MLTLAFWAVAVMSDTTSVAEKQVWEAVLAINRTWASERDLTKLATLLHPDMVLIDPATNVSGRDIYVLVHENGRWLAVADQFSEFPKSS